MFTNFELLIPGAFCPFLVFVVPGNRVVIEACTHIGNYDTLKWTAIDMQLKDIRARIMAANIDIRFGPHNCLQ
jgi:hypothetical protein